MVMLNVEFFKGKNRAPQDFSHLQIGRSDYLLISNSIISAFK
jgi:hypothetical protein